jgi:hypothetical protein
MVAPVAPRRAGPRVAARPCQPQRRTSHGPGDPARLIGEGVADGLEEVTCRRRHLPVLARLAERPVPQSHRRCQAELGVGLILLEELLTFRILVGQSALEVKYFLALVVVDEHENVLFYSAIARRLHCASFAALAHRTPLVINCLVNLPSLGKTWRVWTHAGKPPPSQRMATRVDSSAPGRPRSASCFPSAR